LPHRDYLSRYTIRRFKKGFAMRKRWYKITLLQRSYK